MSFQGSNAQAVVMEAEHGVASCALWQCPPHTDGMRAYGLGTVVQPFLVILGCPASIQ